MKVNNKTIIITDPCYIIPDEKDDDWYKCNYGLNMKILGITHYTCADTRVGDWSCTTYDDHSNILGTFTADAGMVGVFELDEVLKYNPNFDSSSKCCTVIPDFTGTIIIQKNDDGVTVVGSGNINFYTKQTGW